MRLRDWVPLIYGLVLLGGTAIILKRNGIGENDFVAQTDMPLNWRLQANDDVKRGLTAKVASPGDAAALDAFTGRYLRGHVQPNEMLTLRQTDSAPDIVTPPGHVMVLAPFDSTAVKPVNAGTCVTVRGFEKVAVTVAAVLCPVTGAPACNAVLDLPAGQIAAITAGGKGVPAIVSPASCTK